MTRILTVSLAAPMALLLACGNGSSTAECGPGDGCGPVYDPDVTVCSSDLDCPSGMCGADGICIESQGCFVTSECPLDRYCNTALPVPMCAPLPPGSCREDSQCGGLLCSALSGGLGSCVECLSHGDCASGVCGMDGTCQAQASVQTLDCPPNASPDGDTCRCNAGFVLSEDGSECLPDTSATSTTPPSDPCADAGLYGDGSCDLGCPQPDPDCEGGGDICAEEDWYGDGYCDEVCAEPDPDCEGGAGDICAQRGWYGDGFCDEMCAEPDPDCEEEGDICAERGWYGDGVCDEECAEPDPDCEESSGGCDGETYYGRCVGNTLVYCDDDTVYYVDCYEYDGVCELYSYQEGYDCVTYY